MKNIANQNKENREEVEEDEIIEEKPIELEQS